MYFYYSKIRINGIIIKIITILCLLGEYGADRQGGKIFNFNFDSKNITQTKKK